MFGFRNKEIILSDMQKKDLIAPILIKGGTIKIGTTLFVPENYVFAIGIQGKVLDLLSQGTYCLTEGTLPLTNSRLRLYKKDKNGKSPTGFKANLYFINLNEFIIEKPFTIYRKLEFMNKGKIVREKIEVDYKFKIVSPKDFLSFALSEFDYLKKGEALIIFKDFIEENTAELLDKKKLELRYFNDEQEKISKEVFDELKNKSLKIGVDLNKFNVKIKSFNKNNKNEEQIIDKTNTEV